ncbi:hypothetical protein ACJX0J_030406, partial [Zea mays]
YKKVKIIVEFSLFSGQRSTSIIFAQNAVVLTNDIYFIFCLYVYLPESLLSDKILRHNITYLLPVAFSLVTLIMATRVVIRMIDAGPFSIPLYISETDRMKSLLYQQIHTLIYIDVAQLCAEEDMDILTLKKMTEKKDN